MALLEIIPRIGGTRTATPGGSIQISTTQLPHLRRYLHPVLILLLGFLVKRTPRSTTILCHSSLLVISLIVILTEGIIPTRFIQPTRHSSVVLTNDASLMPEKGNRKTLGTRAIAIRTLSLHTQAEEANQHYKLHPALPQLAPQHPIRCNSPT